MAKGRWTFLIDSKSGEGIDIKGYLKGYPFRKFNKQEVRLWRFGM
jgi:hypothetical protein